MFIKELIKLISASQTPKDDLTIKLLDFNNIVNNKSIISDLRKLTLCYSSGMNHALDSLTDLSAIRKVNAKVITATRNNKMIGWALLSKENSNFCFRWGSDGFNAKRDGALFEVFVDPKHRRTGVGSALLKKARKHAGAVQLCVAPHDNAGHSFFYKHKNYKQKKLS